MIMDKQLFFGILLFVVLQVIRVSSRICSSCFNSFPTSDTLCCLVIAFANSLDTVWACSGFEMFDTLTVKSDFDKNQQKPSKITQHAELFSDT